MNTATNPTPALAVLADLDIPDRDTAIAYIKAQLKKRTGYSWSVRGGKGTAWGWIKINAQPKDRTWTHVATGAKDEHGQDVYEMRDTGSKFGSMSPQLQKKLADALGLEHAHYQGVNIPASADYRREYCERAAGKPVTKKAQPYWD